MKRILTILVLILFANVALAVPAVNKVIEVKQADGTVLRVRLRGDEYFHWRTTEKGTTPIVKKNGFYYYASYDLTGEIQPTQQRVMQNGRIAAPANNLVSPNMRQFAARRNSEQRSKRLGALPKRSQKTINAQSSTEENSTSVTIPTLDTGFPTTGEVRSIILLVEFQDVRFTIDNPQQAFTNSLNQKGYNLDGATGSAADYFHANSGDCFDVTFDVYGPYTLPEDMAFYGNNSYYGDDNDPQQMVIDGAYLANRDGVDFSQYDYDNDGEIDNVFIYYAGHNEAEGGPEDSVWPHKWNVPAGNYFDGLELNVYACSSELRGNYGTSMAGIGTFCHEFSHVFGFADHYDTNYTSGGYSEALGYYDIMCAGSYNNDGHTPPMMNGLELLDLGWATPKTVDHSQDIVQQPISNKDVYVIGTENEGEFFVVENRRFEDNVWDEHLPGEGLLITQVDRTPMMLDLWTRYNTPNSDPSHECFKFIPASGEDLNSGYADWSDIGYPSQGGNNQWNEDSSPRAESWDNLALTTGFYNIRTSGLNSLYYAMNVNEADINQSHIRGRVVDAVTGQGVAGVELTIQKYNSAQMPAPYLPVANSGDVVDIITTDNEGRYSYSSLQYQKSYTLSYIAKNNDRYLSSSALLTNLMLHDKLNHEATVNVIEDMALEQNTLGELNQFSYADPSTSPSGLNGDATLNTSMAIRLETKEYVGHKIIYGDVLFGDLANNTTELTIVSLEGDNEVVSESYSRNNMSISGACNIYKLGAPVVIYPDRTYYAVVTCQGMVKVDESVTNENANLRLVNNREIKSSGNDGALCISVYISTEEPEELESISIEAKDSSKSPLLGVEYPLVAVLTPTNTAWTALEWSSSDSEVATVDNNGVVVFNAAGDVVITAKSSYFEGVEANITISCDSRRVLLGMVSNEKHSAIANQEVVLYPLISSFTKGISAKNFTRATDKEPLKVVTDANGEFVCDVAEDYYELVVVANNFNNYNAIVAMGDDVTKCDVQLQSKLVASSNYFANVDSSLSGIEHFGADGNSFAVYEKWQAATLRPYVGGSIESIKAELADDAIIRFVVLKQEGPSFDYEQMYVSQPIVSKGYNCLTHDIPAEKRVEIEKSSDYYVGYYVDQSSVLSHPAVLRQSKGTKSSFVSFDDKEMINVVSEYLSDEPYIWSIGFYVHSDVPLDTYKLFVGQVDASLTWYSQDFTNFRITLLGENGEQQFESETSSFDFVDLVPNGSYDVVVEGSHDESDFTTFFSASFKTIARKVDFPGILISDYEWNEGDVLDFKAINLNDGDSVEWFVNGDKLLRPTLVLVKGKHKVECRVKRDGNTEYCATRYINVKEK